MSKSSSTNNSGATRDLKTQEPGGPVDDSMMPPQEGAEEKPESGAGGADVMELSPELASYIDAKIAEGVRAGVKAERRQDMLNKRRAKDANQEHLPSQAEAMAQAKKVGRAVLSRDGWCCPTRPEDVNRVMR